MQASRPEPLFRFAAFELDPAREELRRDGRKIHLAAQPFRLLKLLLENPGEIVNREEIQHAVWDAETHVDFDQSINTCVRQVRQALDDHADSPRFLQTVPRKGYRFVAPVNRVVFSSMCHSSRRPSRSWAVAALAVVVVFVLALVVVGILTSGSNAGDDPRPVVAVLPFENLGSDDGDDYLGDALTEEMIAQLGRRYAQRMVVIARTSSMKYKGTDKSIDEIADELDADYLLEGSIRSAGDRLRVTAQLIRAEDSSHMWASNYDRGLEHPLEVQVEICDRIADALAIKLLAGEIPRGGPVTEPEVYDLYLRGVQLLSGFPTDEASTRAMELLERVVESDPGFAPAWVALARARNRGFDQESRASAREALERAMALDNALPRAHLILAEWRFYQEYDLEGARLAYERAIELNPTFAEAHHSFAAYWSVTGNHDMAVASVQRARRIDPLASMVQSDVGWYYYFGRRYDEAIAHSLRTLELDPGFYWAELCIQLAQLQKGDTDGLIDRARRLVERIEPDAPERVALAGGGPPAARAVWQWRMRRMESAMADSRVAPSDVGQLAMALGDHARTLELLERSFELRAGWILPFLTVDPLFDPLREDPRFVDLVTRVSGSELIASR